jgi:ABC-type transport system substrate-binding protein
MDGASILLSSYGTPEQGNRLHEDPELYQIITDTLAIVDKSQRPQAFNELYRRLREESYEIGVGYVNIPWGVGPRVKTWEPFTFAFYPSGLHTITLE